MVGLNNYLDLDYDTASVKGHDISWIALNSSKPNRRKGKFSLVINSSYDYANKNETLNDDKISNHLLNVASKIMKRDLSKLSLKSTPQMELCRVDITSYRRFLSRL